MFGLERLAADRPVHWPGGPHHAECLATCTRIPVGAAAAASAPSAIDHVFAAAGSPLLTAVMWRGVPADHAAISVEVPALSARPRPPRTWRQPEGDEWRDQRRHTLVDGHGLDRGPTCSLPHSMQRCRDFAERMRDGRPARARRHALRLRSPASVDCGIGEPAASRRPSPGFHGQVPCAQVSSA